MNEFVRALPVILALHLSVGAGCALAQAADATKPTAEKSAEPRKPAMPVARSREIYQSSPRFLAKKYAVAGFDTVAYHKEKKAVEGKDAFAIRWKDATWRFVSQENLDAFVANPEKYAPQYGGYSAYAIAKNELSPGNPRSWEIVDGKLYLNLSRKIQAQWDADQAALIKSADANWPTVLKNGRR